MKLGEKIRELRIANDTTQRELSDALGVDHSYISKIERGKAFPGRQFIVNAARVLGVSVNGLTGGAEVVFAHDGMIALRIWPNSTIHYLTLLEATVLRDGLDAILPRPDVLLCNRCRAKPATNEPLCVACREDVLTERLHAAIAEMDANDDSLH